MEENFTHRVSRRNHGGTHWRRSSSSSGAGAEDHRRRRHHLPSGGGDEDDDPEVKCSSSGGKKYRSWAAAAIADCVALCCCPCAVVNLLTLAFVKVPWMIGRRCLSRAGGRRRRKRKIQYWNRGKAGREEMFHRRFETAAEEECGGDDHRFVVERDGSLTKEDEKKGKTTSLGEEDEARISARVEAERVWLELYQIGHLGFGRVSFTGIQ